MNSDESSLKPEKRSSSPEDQPPLKRLKDNGAVKDDGSENDKDDINEDKSNDASQTKLPTVKKSENHGITEYVSKAHNGFFGE